MTNANKVVVLGVGVTKFERETAKGLDELGKEAALMALKDAGMKYSDIQMGFCGNVYQAGSAALTFYSMGKTGIPITHIDIACASSTRSVQLASACIESGHYDPCMLIGVEKMPRGMVPMPIDPEAVSTKNEMLYDSLNGLITMPGAYAHHIVRHMHLYGTKPEHIAQCAVIADKNSCLNPNAVYGKERSLEEVMNSRMIAYPLTMYECCANCSGATSVIVCSEEKAESYNGKPVELAGWDGASMKYVKGDPVETSISEGYTPGAAERAYEMAGVGPEDIGVAQVHDAFSSGVIIHIEELGLCPKGEGGFFVWEGNTEIDGKIPVNTDGGVVGRGHPIGATGGAQIAELVRQLRGEAGKRQVKDPEVAILQNSGLGATNVMIFKKM